LEDKKMKKMNKKLNRAVYTAAMVGAGLATAAIFPADASATPSTASFTGSYTPDFSQLIYNTSGADENAANATTINGNVYALSGSNAGNGKESYFDFAGAQDTLTTDANTPAGGGLGLTGLSGWYGAGGVNGSLGTAGVNYGAQIGDTTTGGVISFGAASSSTRALGLLSSGTVGYTATGVELINNTSSTINSVNVNFVWELFHETNKAQIETGYYTVDNSASDTIISALTAAESATNGGVLPGANGSYTSATGTATNGPVNPEAYAGTLTGLNWSVGGALWLTFADSGGTSGSGGISIQTDSVAGVDSNAFVSTSSTPEPATLGLLAVGALGLLKRRRTRA
jgi:hypothetical protein